MHLLWSSRIVCLQTDNGLVTYVDASQRARKTRITVQEIELIKLNGCRK